MWDSTINPQAGPTPAADDPGSGVINTLGVAMPALNAATGSASTTLTLTPPPAALTGPNVIYPLYIDPSLAKGRAHFAVVFNNGTPTPWHYYDDTSNDLKVGYCGWSDCNGIGTGRTYLSFDTSLLAGQPTTAHIYSADVEVYEIHNAAGCSTTEPVDLYTSGGFDGSTTWPGPAASKLQSVSSANDSACNTAGMVTFNNSSVLNQFQAIANNDTRVSSFALLADNEQDANQWKRFASDPNGSPVAQISVNYVYPPSTPQTLHINAINCTGTNYTNTSTPTLHAVAVDNNVPTKQSIQMHYHLTGPTTLSSPAITSASGADAVWTASSPLTDGNYTATAYANSTPSPNPIINSGTTTYAFTVKTSIPAAPTIASFDYPQNYWGAPQGQPGSFMLKGSSDTVGFTYSFTSSNSELAPSSCSYNSGPTTTGGMTAASGGNATITLPSGLSTGYHQIWVKAFDNAHNISGESGYTFYVAPTIAGEGATRLEAETLATSTATRISVPSGDYAYVETWPSSGFWSGNQQEHLVANAGSPTNPTQFSFTFTVPLGAPYDYALGAEVTTASHFGILNFELDHQLIDLNGTHVRVDTYSANPATTYVPLGGASLTPGQHTLTVDIIGTSGSNYTYNGTYGTGTNGTATINNYNDNGYSAGIDYFTAVPLTGGATTLTGAMNNHGIANDNVSGADIGPSNGQAAISQQTLTAAGITAGQTFTTNGVTFTMPTYNTNGDDNAMADGQPITLPQQVNANHVDLLVASTCGATALSPDTKLGIGFSDGTYFDSEIPSVPDWNNQSPTLQNTPQTPTATIAAATATPLPYRDTGPNGTPEKTGGVGTNPVHLYVLTIPTQYNDGTTNSHVTTVTLPTLGSNFTEACNTPTLHVLAITTDTN